MKKGSLRAFALLICACCLGMTAMAQHSTTVQVTEIMDDGLKEEINTAISGLLTSFNNAQITGQKPSLSHLDLAPDVRVNIEKLWNNCPFRCLETLVIERAVKTPRGEYQVRNIPLIMMPIEGVSSDISWKKYQEAVFTIDKTGMVTDFHLAIDANLYVKVMNSAKSNEDLINRTLITEYVERFRNAYNIKDINFLNQVFSDDALIITGKVVTPVKSDINKANMSSPKVVYTQQKKKAYLSRLESIFKRNKRINVVFDEIKVVRHPAKDEFYGVTLKQGWTSDTYSDEGWLFLLWDFSNPDAPKIHVRTWQPDKYDDGTKIPEEDYEYMDIMDFVL